MEIRERIISTATELMLRLGISSVTMDTIASQCGISKRTLYELFSDKRTLVRIILQHLYMQRNLKFSRAIKKSANRLEAILNIYFITREYVMNVSEVFVSDIERLYPEIQSECATREHKYVLELIRLIEEGQEEGVFRATDKVGIAAILFSLQMRQVKPNISQFPQGTSVFEVLDTSFINFVRGIASPAGLEIIDKALAEHNIEQ